MRQIFRIGEPGCSKVMDGVRSYAKYTIFRILTSKNARRRQIFFIFGLLIFSSLLYMAKTGGNPPVKASEIFAKIVDQETSESQTSRNIPFLAYLYLIMQILLFNSLL